MIKQAADVILTKLADHAVALGIEEFVDIALPQGLMNMHPGAVILEKRFRHEGDGVTILVSNVLGDIFIQHYAVSLFEQGVEAHTEFHLAAVATS